MWKYAAGVAGVALIGFALWLGITKYGAAQYQAGRLSLAVEAAKAEAEGERRVTAAFERGVEQGQAATRTFIEWREGPLRIQRETITREIDNYRQSAAGGAICFDADGVSQTNQDIRAINATAFTSPATGSGATVRTDDGDRDADGRERDPRPGEGDDRARGAIESRVREEKAVTDRGLASPVMIEALE